MSEFVSFEIAKKLKEKGFDRPCTYAYCEKGGWNKYKQVHEPITHILRTDGNPFGTFYTGKNWNIEYETNKNKIRCSAPTISQVLKWLRERDIMVEIIPSLVDDGTWTFSFRIQTKKFYDRATTDYTSYELAALACIEYVLDNLI